jgi:hypothetical protein
MKIIKFRDGKFGVAEMAPRWLGRGLHPIVAALDQGSWKPTHFSSIQMAKNWISDMEKAMGRRR